MELEELKGYIRVDEDEDDVLVQSLKIAAENYLLNAGINEKYEDELYSLAVKMLVGHWYDLRGTVNVGNEVTEIPYTLKPIILQLQMGDI